MNNVIKVVSEHNLKLSYLRIDAGIVRGILSGGFNYLYELNGFSIEELKSKCDLTDYDIDELFESIGNYIELVSFTNKDSKENKIIFLKNLLSDKYDYEGIFNFLDLLRGLGNTNLYEYVTTIATKFNVDANIVYDILSVYNGKRPQNTYIYRKAV